MTLASSLRGPVFVAGPPGAGKSTLSKTAASRLRLPWLDTDEEVERRVGRSPAQIIEDHSESTLRSEELRVVEQLGGDPVVVSLGGGAWADGPTRAAVRRRGPVVGLAAERDVLWSRLQSSDQSRPLSRDRESFDHLLDQRDSVYERVDRAIRTDEGDAATTLQGVLSELGFAYVELDGCGTRVVVGRALGRATGGAVAELKPSRPILLLEDANAPTPHRDAHAASIEATAGPVVRRVLPGGEAVKTWTVLGEVLEFALASGAGRQSVVVGLGGGAVCDLAAMVAGLLGRGAPLVLVPTTLLAQVDASVGGKAAVNLAGLKNPVGSFTPAHDVIVDLEFLASLDPDRVREGRAESYKAALLSSDADRRALLQAEHPTVDSVLRAIETKARIVSADPREGGVRKLLNLGHTWGHAVEAASDHRIPHGVAVGIGIAFIARWSSERGLMAPSTRDQILEDLAALDLPSRTPPDLLAPALERLRADKKGGRSRVDLVALRDIGRPEIVNCTWEELERELLRLEK